MSKFCGNVFLIIDFFGLLHLCIIIIILASKIAVIYHSMTADTQKELVFEVGSAFIIVTIRTGQLLVWDDHWLMLVHMTDVEGPDTSCTFHGQFIRN